MISSPMYELFRDEKNAFSGRDVALILDSTGGNAEAAYRIARLFQRKAKSFAVVVPRFAKSAATLLSLGAETIILGEDAELGPLDVQIWDHDHEERRVSALDTVQAVEQLEDSAIEVAIRMLKYLKIETKKRYTMLLEPSLQFAAQVTKPLFEKIDAVNYSRQSRVLKEAEDYAVRLLMKKFPKNDAEGIARALVTRYATHEFVIDVEECQTIGMTHSQDVKDKKPLKLHAALPDKPDVAKAVEDLYNAITGVTALGKLVPVPPKGGSP